MRFAWHSRRNPTAFIQIGQLMGYYLIKGQNYINFRHPGYPNAFANFVNVNEAFVEIIKDFESRAMQSGSEVRILNPQL